MGTLKTLFIGAVALLAAACATEPPVPVTVDGSAPAVAEAEGLRGALRVLRSSEIGQQFGGHAAARLGVVELKLVNRSALPVSLEHKQIHMVSPDGKEMNALRPLRVAYITRGAGPSNCGADNTLCMIQLFFALGALSQNQQLAAKWEPLMPETFKLASGEEGRMLLVFDTPHWAPGLWRLELPLTADSGAAGPRLSVPIRFRVLDRPPD